MTAWRLDTYWEQRNNKKLQRTDRIEILILRSSWQSLFEALCRGVNRWISVLELLNHAREKWDITIKQRAAYPEKKNALQDREEKAEHP
jgi:hypothetical protein